MIRKKEDQAIEFRCIRGGKGETEQRKIAESVEELYGKGRLFNYMIIQPGNSIGEHTHEGDNEIFHFIKGTGEYNDNGTIVEVGPDADPGLVGKRGAIFPCIPCMKCDSCLTGNYAMCDDYDYLGSRSDGGFAEYCLVPSAWHSQRHPKRHTRLVSSTFALSTQVTCLRRPRASS